MSPTSHRNVASGRHPVRKSSYPPDALFRPAASAQTPTSPMLTAPARIANGVRRPGFMTSEGKSGRIANTATTMTMPRPKTAAAIHRRARSLSESCRSAKEDASATPTKPAR